MTNHTPPPESEPLAALGAAEPTTCPCCLGDPDTVCSACLHHDCWAGRFMCEDSRGAGTVQLSEFEQRGVRR